MKAKLMELAERVKTEHGYDLAHEIAEVARGNTGDNLSAGRKDDQEKTMYNLLPPNAIDSMAKVMTFGANKYAPNSWQNVDNGLERYRAALLRHTFAIQRGEHIDPESKLPHSAHIMCCAAFINELEQA